MSDHYIQLVMEHFDSKFDAVTDIFQTIINKMSKMARASDLEEVKQDVKIIKAAITSTNQDVRGRS